MAKKRAAGGGRKEDDHWVRLQAMARLLVDGKCASPEAAAWQVARDIFAQGAAYDWQSCPRSTSVESLARRLKVQWARDGRGQALLVAESAERKRRKEASVRQLQQALHQYLASLPPPPPIAQLHFTPQQKAVEELGRSLEDTLRLATRAAADPGQSSHLKAIIGEAVKFSDSAAAGSTVGAAAASAFEQLLVTKEEE